MYLGPVRGSDHLRTRTWPFWTEPMVWSKVRHNQWTEPIVRFRVLQNPLKNRTEPNLTIPIYTILYIKHIMYKFTYKLSLYSEIPTVQMQNIHSKWWTWWKKIIKIVIIVIRLIASIHIGIDHVGEIFWIFGIIFTYSPISHIYLPLSICNGSQSWLETVLSLIMISCIL
jgi:hypothetical protein